MKHFCLVLQRIYGIIFSFKVPNITTSTPSDATFHVHVSCSMEEGKYSTFITSLESLSRHNLTRTPRKKSHNNGWVALSPQLSAQKTTPFIACRKTVIYFPLFIHLYRSMRTGDCTERSCSRCRCRPGGCTPGCGSPWSGRRRGSVRAVTFIDVFGFPIEFWALFKDLFLI